MADPVMPNDVQNWMNMRNWGTHHVEWHAVRQWDRQSPAARQQMIQLGWQRAQRQEGEDGNGMEFLMMHRAMLQLLRQNFPAQAALFTGWTSPPTNPDDPNDPMPANGQPRPFDSDMQSAIDRLQNDLGSFASEDQLGLYLETFSRPTPQNPGAQSSDQTAGIHNYLHNRFSDDDSPVNMGDPEVNLGNQRFWRLHGWIDSRWAAYRQLKGLSDTDALYTSTLAAEKQHLEQMGHHHSLESLEMASDMVGRLPRALRRPFAESKSTRFLRMMASDSISTLDELKERIQLAIELEFFTIPPYLTAAWSLKSSADAKIAAIILSVAMQEMLHMGLSCNLLCAIGGKPELNTPTAVPHYPNFPPGVQLDQPVELLPLDGAKQVIEQFMQIEKPEFPPIEILEMVASDAPKFPTIGEFYDSILEGLATVNPTFSTAGQLATTFSNNDELFVIANMEDAKKAINLIKQQGEGTPASPGDGTAELAHYYRFEQIKDEVQYVKQSDGTYKKDRTRPIHYPAPTAIFPMGRIPTGGYPDVPAVDAFNQKYTRLVNLLHQAWYEGSQSAFDNAVGVMYELQGPAQELMNTPRDPKYGEGNYGPTFALVTAVAGGGPPSGGGGGAGAGGAGQPGGGGGAVAVTYARVQQILENAVHGDTIQAHGPFWRTLTRDQFVAKAIFGKKLIAVRTDGSFDPDESNFVKALEGRAPFGSDLTPAPAGATLRRMPAGYDPVPQAQINEIRSWIQAGCPA